MFRDKKLSASFYLFVSNRVCIIKDQSYFFQAKLIFCRIMVFKLFLQVFNRLSCSLDFLVNTAIKISNISASITEKIETGYVQGTDRSADQSFSIKSEKLVF